MGLFGPSKKEVELEKERLRSNAQIRSAIAAQQSEIRRAELEDERKRDQEQKNYERSLPGMQQAFAEKNEQIRRILSESINDERNPEMYGSNITYHCEKLNSIFKRIKYTYPEAACIPEMKEELDSTLTIAKSEFLKHAHVEPTMAKIVMALYGLGLISVFPCIIAVLDNVSGSVFLLPILIGVVLPTYLNLTIVKKKKIEMREDMWRKFELQM